MSGHEIRTIKNKKKIENSTLELLQTFQSKITIQQIADHSKISHVSIYNYYGSKEELIKQTILNDTKKQLKNMEELMSLSDITFIDVMNHMLRLKLNSMKMMDSWILDLILKSEEITQLNLEGNKLFSKLIEFGKMSGSISKNIPTPTIIEYTELIQVAYTQLQFDEEKTKQFFELYFYGLKGE